MSDWSDDSQALFGRARRALAPTPADRTRVRARIARAMAVGVATGVAVTVGSSASAAAPAKALAFPLAAKIALGVVVLGVAGGFARLFAVGAASRPPTTSAPAPAPANVGSAAPADSAADIVTIAASDLPSAPPAPSASARASAARTDARTTPDDEEAALVARIDAALRSGDASTAAKLAAEHERRFPHGLLVEEREGARILSRCMTGSASRASAEAFLAAHPRSPMRARILAVCKEDDR